MIMNLTRRFISNAYIIHLLSAQTPTSVIIVKIKKLFYDEMQELSEAYSLSLETDKTL